MLNKSYNYIYVQIHLFILFVNEMLHEIMNLYHFKNNLKK